MVYVWLVVIALALIVEASTATLVAIWFIPSAIVAAILAKIGVSVILQTVVFFVLSIVLILLTRKILAKTLKPEFVPTNADALIGKTATVTCRIVPDDAQGLVKVNGQVWSAQSEKGNEIEEGTAVEIVSIKGVKLIVKERI